MNEAHIFRARYAGTCPACNLPIRRGAPVGYEGKTLLHEQCLRPFRQERPSPA